MRDRKPYLDSGCPKRSRGRETAGQGFRDGVHALHTRDFFDKIHFAAQVGTPARGRDLPVRLVGAVKAATQTFQRIRAERGLDIHAEQIHGTLNTETRVRGCPQLGLLRAGAVRTTPPESSAIRLTAYPIANRELI